MTRETFESTLFRMAPVPSEAAPQAAGPWGRTPIRATARGRKRERSS